MSSSIWKWIDENFVLITGASAAIKQYLSFYGYSDVLEFIK